MHAPVLWPLQGYVCNYHCHCLSIITVHSYHYTHTHTHTHNNNAKKESRIATSNDSRCLLMHRNNKLSLEEMASRSKRAKRLTVSPSLVFKRTNGICLLVKQVSLSSVGLGQIKVYLSKQARYCHVQNLWFPLAFGN